MKFGTHTLPKKDPKNINHLTHPFSSADISIFSPEIGKIFLYQEHRYGLHFDIQFLIFSTFFESLKIFLINIATIVMMLAKMATLGLPKIKVFWKKDYGIIISVHDVTNKILSRGTNYVVDVVMWPNLSNSSISMREVIMTSIL